MTDGVPHGGLPKGYTFAADEIGNVKHPRVKIQTGPDGTASDVSPASPLPVTDFLVEVAKGNVAGHALVHKYGRNPDIDAGIFETVWNGGGPYTGFNATAAETVEVFSSDAADAAAGTGARTMQMVGLGDGFVEQSEIISLGGLTVVETVLDYIRCPRGKILTGGAGGENAGFITARQKVTPANIFMVLPAGYNRTMIAAYTVPAGKTAYLLGWFATIAKKQAAFSSARLRCRPFGGVSQVKEELTVSSTGSSYVYRPYKGPKDGLPEKTDIYVEADSDTNDMGVAGGFDLLLVDN